MTMNKYQLESGRVVKLQIVHEELVKFDMRFSWVQKGSG